MSEPKKTASRGRLRRLLQFRISSVLLLTLVAAVGMFFYTLPEVVEENDETGQFRSVYQVYRDGDGKAVRHGLAKLYDEDGRNNYQQHFRGGKDAGKWAYYGPDGSRWQGEIRDGQRHGTWIESHPDGTKRSELRYVEGKLRGKTQAWWPGGKVRYTGAYNEGRRSGKWTFRNKHGAKTAAGEYRAGVKHGRWQQWDNKSARLVAHQYLRGRLVRNADAVVKQWRRRLFGDHLAQRAEAAWALGQLAELGVDVLKEASESTDLDLRRRAFEQLARNDDWCKAHIGRLIAALEEKSLNAQPAAIIGLARVGSPAKAALPKLRELSRADEDALRRPAIAALASIAPERDEYIELLVEEFGDLGSFVWGGTGVGFGPIGPPIPFGEPMPYLSRETIRGLCRLLRNGDPNQRGGAAYLLSTFFPAPEEALPVLIKALDDSDANVRGHACVVLRNLGPAAKKAVEKLKALQKNDKNQMVASEAARALMSIDPDKDWGFSALLSL